MTKKYYHVTDKRNLDSIMRRGLVPIYGERSYKAQEPRALIFLFRTKEDMEDALLGWMMEEYVSTDANELVILEITPPSNVEIVEDNLCMAKFEAYCEEIILPQYISVIRYEKII